MELLQHKGCEVHAYAESGPERSRLEKNGVVCHDIPISRSPLRSGNLKALSLLTASFRKEEFRLVHVHTPVASILGRIAAHRAGVPCTIYTAHGFHFFKGAPIVNWMIYYPLERLMARFTHILITINNEDWKRASRFPVRNKVKFVSGVGINIGNYGGSRRISPEEKSIIREQRLGLFDEEEGQSSFVVLCIAELNANKNQKQLIEALGLLSRQGERVHLVLAGSGPSELHLREVARSLGVERQVHWMGHRSDIPELLETADAAALVSLREGLPRSVMEAMAAGKPVIGTNIRGVRDLIEDGETGLLVPSGDPAATAQAILKLKNHPELVNKMGEASRVRIRKFSLSEVLPIMDEIYTGALQWSGEFR